MLFNLVSMASVALFLTPIMATAVPKELLLPRDCVNQDVDPAGIICVGDDGSFYITDH